MSALAVAATDTATLLRRNLRHAQRYPALTVGAIVMPLGIFLLFAGVLGETLNAGLGSARPDGGGYVDYVTPGIILMTVASGCLGTSVMVCVDLTSGIVDRLRTLAISRGALLSAHVAGSMLVTLAGTVLVVAVAFLLGLRPQAGPVEWLALAGLILLVTLALTWVAVLIGLLSRTPESASNTPLLLQVLPFLSGAFVPAESLPGSVRWFAEIQPFTPIVETARALLAGAAPAGGDAAAAVGWCVALTLAGYLGSLRAFDRRRPA